MLTDILQPTHLLFILLVALLVLGPKRLPEVGRSLGKGLRDFRGAMAGIEEHTTGLFDPDPPASSNPVATVPTAPEPAVTTTVTGDSIVEPSTHTVATAAPAQDGMAFRTTSATPVKPASMPEPDPSEYAD